MQYTREIVHEPQRYDKRHLASASINSPTFAAMKIKQGGYGILDDTFWVQRMSRRGFHVVVLTLSGKGKYLMEDGTEHTAKPGEAFISNAMGQGHHEETVGPIPWEMIWLTIWEEKTPPFLPQCLDYAIIPFANGPLLLVSIEVRNLVDGNHPKAPGSFHAAHSSSRFCSMIAFALR
jgi:hypothetical protein